MKKMTNSVHVEGYLYEHDLKKKVSGPTSKKPGTEFISGTIGIATDEEMKNIVEIHYTYTTATTSKGNPNATYGVLSDIIDGKLKTAMEVGKEEAAKLKADTAIGLNDYYSENNNDWVLSSPKRNEGGFVSRITAINDTNRNNFKCDMIITKCTRMEEDPERSLPERMNVSGVIFDFRNQILPVTFITYNEKAMDSLEGQGISEAHPFCTQINGNQVNATIVRKIVEENAWGADVVREATSTRREFVITHGGSTVYEWDSEDFVTGEEFKSLVANRETHLAEVKQRAIEWKEQRAAQNAAPAVAAAAAMPTSTAAGFNF